MLQKSYVFSDESQEDSWRGVIFSPQWKTQEAEFYTKWRMATVAAVATSRHTLFTSAAKESNQKATVFLLPIPGPPQEGNADSRGGSPSFR